MDVSDFKTLFGDSIRAWLDWDALHEENARVEDRVLSAREDIGDLYTVWHVDPDGNPGEWSHPQHRPLTVADAASRSWPEGRQEKIERFQEDFSGKHEPVVLTVPAYRADDVLVVLDSSHRVVGGYLSEAELRVLLVVLAGPASSLVLPGLAQVENHLADRI
ncbi:hypothetical protein [Kocuria sp.]|uniref:hypothetical protein n=1 Tax=Kocuria sp. TaxID=1871328 RepID=UPI0028121955|nr:hypothetical protein [Kocuria sp.]